MSWRLLAGQRWCSRSVEEAKGHLRLHVLQKPKEQGSTAPSEPPGAEPFGRQGAAPAISGTFQILEGAAPPPKFLLSGGSPLTFDSYPSSPGGQLHRSSSGCGLPQAVMAGRKSLLSFGFSSNRAQQGFRVSKPSTPAMELHDSMHNSLISSLARKVDQLQFAAFDEELANEDLVDFTHLPENEPEEDSGFDFSETEDEEEAAAEDDELSQAAVHGQSATIDLDEDDGLGEALEVF